MAKSAQEIAGEIMVAWIANQTGTTPASPARNAFSTENATKNGEYLGEVYKAILTAVGSTTEAAEE